MLNDVKNLTTWRRHLHMNPEISGHEKNTSAFLAEKLEDFGLTVKKGIAGYGLVAELSGDPGRKCVALRADMDALPIMEQNSVEYRSQFPGRMHACGHDAHMAMVLGAAQYFSGHPPKGTVKFIFQPREEKPPGGAKEMIEAGVLNHPRVDAVFGLHVAPDYPAGTVALKNGVTMAIADDFTLTITGRGGHGANPHLGADTIVITAQVIQALQNIVARRIDPADCVVISLGTIHGGTAQNIIPDEVVLTGTVRTLKVETRDRVISLIKDTLQGITAAWGAKYRLDYLYGYPPVVNHPQAADIVRMAAGEISGLTLVEMDNSLMIGEDFAYYGEHVPAAFFLLGCGSEEKKNPLHHSSFDLEESSLSFGTEMLVRCVNRFMAENRL